MEAPLNREESIFAIALTKPTAERTAYLAEACGGDEALRKRVEQLLAASTKAAREADPTETMPPTTDSANVGSRTRATEPDEESLEFLTPSGRRDSLGRIGHYEVLQVLGRGGFGIVFRAFDEMLERVVALKVLSPQMALTSPARKRFLREARSSAQVRHENVVQVYAVEEQPLPYLVMEFIPGETLQQKLNRMGPLDLAETLRIGRQIADGLAAAHAMDLIHRDIKPGNILLENPHGRVKITDFGLARAADDASMTQSGVLSGTPMYMSPEQAMGQPTDQRSDLFGLGSVLYQMVSGRPPFRADSTPAVLRRVAQDKPRPIRQIIPETPQWLCDIIAKLHEKKPDDRYQSAREVADVLADCERQLKADSKLKDFSRIPRPRRPALLRGLWAAAAVVLLSMIALAVTELTGVTHLIRKQTVPQYASKAASPDSTTEPAIEPDRRAAQFVLLAGGIVRVNGQNRDLHATSELPREPFHLTAFVLRGNKQVDDTALACFKDCRSLTSLDLTDTNATDAGLAWFSGCKDLVHVDVGGNKSVTGAGLAVFAGCNNLRELGIWRTKISDSDLADFKRWPNLTTIWLDQTRISDAGLRHLPALPKLKYVLMNILMPNVTAAGVAELRKALPNCRIDWNAPQFQAASYVRFVGGTMQINGQDVKTGEPIGVRYPLELTAVDLSQKRAVRDADLVRFKDCSSLKKLDLRKTSVTAAGVARLKSALPQCRIEWDGDVPPRPTAGSAPTTAPFADADVRRVAALPAAQQVEEVRKELKRRNAAFDGTLTPTIEAGAIVTMRITSDHLTDISPVRALTHARSLEIIGSARKNGSLTDLSPLKGMPLSGLWLGGNKVSDLTPLAGMPLADLGLNSNPVADLSPIKGMRLHVLYLEDTKVTDLRPLAGMPLVYLTMGGHNVTDFSPLKGMPLRSLNCGDTRQSIDLAQVASLPLESLAVYNTPVSSLAPLGGMQLKELYIFGTKVSDLSPLRGMPLTVLDFRGTPVTDVMALKELPLKRINCDFNPQRDTAVFRAIPSLETINNKPVAEFWKEAEKN